ncbi:diguanylate cyclase/phosphodiesterase [Buttiauxella noackiae ATCC 51607]|uniref:Diguanylate cyclase/phosphodiesterase n=1 Tax=Buttiauxella noackiae ATCC 51607 TaxID=1354255 RepID=A0A1B7HG94_9ENTR|nr:EAL domain-containing response regulator [Buttiauxella noackiae]OAT14640.1 diguanylate cyclase/phosphodiesterase [Buttiauxella noackiae ATCC 51607]
MNNPKWILSFVIVAENVFHRRVLCSKINSLGYHNIFMADSCENALLICRQQEIDVLFCELQMPGMDGIALIRNLSATDFRGSIVISSSLKKEVTESILLMGRISGLQMLGSINKYSGAAQIDNLLTKKYVSRAQTNNNYRAAITEEDLQQALAHGVILPWYQPKVSFATGDWLGVEALARWYHPILGYISPSEFIPLAEQSGLIDRLTEDIFYQSIKDASEWYQDGLRINLSVNLSSLSLQNNDLFNNLLKHCHKWNVNPELITLEITEGIFIEDISQSLEVLNRMRMHGFQLSIDDFATGYSFVQKLTMLPFTELKLDKSYVSNCRHNPTSMAVVEYSLKLTQKLGLKSVAEGVEDQLTWKILSELGCDLCQGYFTAYPMPKQELKSWYLKWKRQFLNMHLEENN